MDNKQLNNPLHGIKLSEIVEYLYNEYGWEKLGKKIKINSFTKDPSIKSSLKFLRKTDWARKEVEDLYLWNLRRNATRKPFAKRVFVKKEAVVKKKVALEKETTVQKKEVVQKEVIVKKKDVVQKEAGVREEAVVRKEAAVKREAALEKETTVQKKEVVQKAEEAVTENFPSQISPEKPAATVKRARKFKRR